MPGIFSNSQDIETICLLTDEWIKKSGVCVYICVCIYIYIVQAKKEGNLVNCNNMDETGGHY